MSVVADHMTYVQLLVASGIGGAAGTHNVFIAHADRKTI